MCEISVIPIYVLIFRWSAVPRSTRLFDESELDKNEVNLARTEPVKKCQRALKFFSNSTISAQKNLFNTKPAQKELSKLHKQV